MKKSMLFYTLALLVAACSGSKEGKSTDGWVQLFNGESLDGWKASENPETFSVQDGMIVVDGDRAHLFYTGPVENHNFKDFEFKAQVKTMPGANSGMFFHTQYQEEGWPEKGYEVQVNNTHTDWRKTASLYAVQDVKEAPARDNEWFTQHIIVKGDKITIKVNDKVVNEYREQLGGRLGSGTFALQGHDPESKVYYKEVMVKPLSEK
jgi:hypothetical protein